MQNKIKVFENKQVRTLWNADEEEWYFSVVDIVSVLTDNNYQAARNYWKVLRKRLSDEGSELVTNCNRLKMQASDGKCEKPIALIRKAFCGLCSRFRRRKQSRSKCGWHRWEASGLTK